MIRIIVRTGEPCRGLAAFLEAVHAPEELGISGEGHRGVHPPVPVVVQVSAYGDQRTLR